MRIVFFGSDDFADVHLRALIGAKHKVVACVTPEDRKQDRGMKVKASVIKLSAEEHRIPVSQPAQFNEPAVIDEFRSFAADLFVVIAYGKFLPVNILNIPKFFSVNVHGSLLPKYRGAAPINWAIINGEKQSGISIIKMTEKMDAGDILAQEKIKIAPEDTAVTLRQKMMERGPALLLKVVDYIDTGTLNQPLQQKANEVTFAPKLTKELGQINWQKSAIEIFNLIRGVLPWPGAYTFYKGKTLKILSCRLVENKSAGHTPGEVIEIGKEGIVVSCGDGALLIKEVHLDAGKPMGAYLFTIGHNLKPGFIFAK